MLGLDDLFVAIGHDLIDQVEAAIRVVTLVLAAVWGWAHRAL